MYQICSFYVTFLLGSEFQPAGLSTSIAVAHLQLDRRHLDLFRLQCSPDLDILLLFGVLAIAL